MDEEPSPEAHTEIEDLPIELITHICRFLNLGDRKCASLVNKRWYSAVRNPAFYGLLFLDSMIDFSSPPLSLFGKDNHPFAKIYFKSIKTEFYETFEYWTEIGTHISELVFVDCFTLTNRILSEMLRHFPETKSLEILSQHSLSLDEENLNFQASKVRDLDISSTYLPQNVILNLVKCLPNLNKVIVSAYTFHQTAFEMISPQKTISCLEELSPKVLRLILIDEGEMATKPELLKHLIDIPNLEIEELYVDTSKIPLNHFQALIQGKPVNTLCLHHRTVSAEGYVDTINQNLKNLKTLGLDMGQNVVQNVIPRISNLSELESLTIRARTEERIVVTDRTMNFPKLERLEFICSLHNSFALSMDVMEMLTKNAPNLTVLNISFTNIDNEALQVIFKNCRMLRGLYFVDQLKINDIGFTGLYPQSGEKAFKEPYSLADLKGLRTLCVHSCKSITNFSLENCFKLLELRYLRAENLPNITYRGILAMIKACPSLEELNISFCQGITDRNFTRQQISAHAPRLKKLIV